MLASNVKINDRQLRAEQDLSVTYPIEYNSDGIIFMRFRGNRIGPNTFPNMKAFKNAFAPVWNSTMHLCQYCSPGDTLPHNMVFDGTQLHLIDADEAFSQNIMERPPPEDLNDENWLEAVRYPDYLRKNVWAYALVQLTYSCFVMSDDILKEGNDDTLCTLLQSRLQELGTKLLHVLADHNEGKQIKTNPQPMTHPYDEEWKDILTVIANEVTKLLGQDLPAEFLSNM